MTNSGGCCRFACRSPGEQARLALLPEAAAGLGQEYLLGVVAERMAREGDGAVDALDSEGMQQGKGRSSSQLKPRAKQQVLSFFCVAEVSLTPPPPPSPSLCLLFYACLSLFPPPSHACNLKLSQTLPLCVSFCLSVFPNSRVSVSSCQSL